ncbi:MAG: carboxypeptidase regulatory-like domain-containing protein [Deltaproteobacteria bacterium]|nr:carboxypeptidase regulatory-like domain-containing protein [Deltaproteobacteria bacterium]
MRASHLPKTARAPASGATVTPLPLHRLRRAALPVALAGEVVDARTREPVAGARASLAEPVDVLCRLAPPPPSRSRRGVADAEGRFELPAPDGRTCWLLVHHPRYLPELVEVRPGHREVTVELQRPGVIRGRLLDAAGLPLPHVRVRGFCPAAVDVAEAVTGADGAFQLDGLRPGQWLLGPDGASPAGLSAALVELLSGETAETLLRPAPATLQPVC